MVSEEQSKILSELNEFEEMYNTWHKSKNLVVKTDKSSKTVLRLKGAAF